MKKFFCLLMALCFLTMTVSAEVFFYDVDIGTDYGRAIYAMSERGIINGYGNGFFGPEDTLTRAQAVKIINKVFMYETKGDIDFTDVSPDAWYYNDVAIAVNAGYIKGYGNGLFGPEDTLTREQVCVMLDNIMNFVMLPLDKSPSDEVSPWAEESVKKILSNHLDTLDENGNYRATEDITREEACLILSQFVLDVLPEIEPFDLKSIARDQLEERLSRVIVGIKNDLMKKTDDEEINSVFLNIALNMEKYLEDENFDYKAQAEKTKESYRKLPKEKRVKAKGFLVEFFIDEKYAEDINILYEFFF